MRFTWLVFVVLGAVLAVICTGWLLAHRAGVRSGKKGRVADTSYLRGLPKYQAFVCCTRVSLAMAFVYFLITVITTSVSVGTPIDRYVKHDKSVNRDTALYPGASGLILSYGSKIGRTFREIISHFEGERILLQLWDVYSMTVSPLTDDYEMATNVPQDMPDTIGTGLTRIGGRLSAMQEPFDYLTSVMDENREVSSIVGDSLVSCVIGFDHNDKQRSRTILLVADNKVHGDGVYNLSKAIELAKSQGVTVTTLYPGSDITLGSEVLQLYDKVHKAGGDFYDASSPPSVDRVVKQIEAEQKEELDPAGKTLETGRPGAALRWTLLGVMFLLGLLASGGL